MQQRNCETNAFMANVTHPTRRMRSETQGPQKNENLCPRGKLCLFSRSWPILVGQPDQVGAVSQYRCLVHVVFTELPSSSPYYSSTLSHQYSYAIRLRSHVMHDNNSLRQSSRQHRRAQHLWFGDCRVDKTPSFGNLVYVHRSYAGFFLNIGVRVSSNSTYRT